MCTTSGQWSVENVNRSKPLLVSLTSERGLDVSVFAFDFGKDRHESSGSS